MRTLKLTIAYDGTAYAGWQVQPGRTTVQETLEKAIARVTGQHTRVLASGRTDAGVHAAGQVVGFCTDSALPPDVLLRALNANLPSDIVVVDAADADRDFHPIRDAVRKRYRYAIHDGPIRPMFERHFVWHYRYGRLDAEAMQRAARALVGRHDFSSFESSGAPRKTSVRTVFEISVERGRAGQLLPSTLGRGAGGEGEEHRSTLHPTLGCVERTADSVQAGARHAPYQVGQGRGGGPDFIIIEIEADGFLYNMVRAIVGTLIEVGRGIKPETWPSDVLHAADRRLAGPTAPPQGLCLLKVEY